MKTIDQLVLQALQEHFHSSSYSPTVREIADSLKINSSGYIHDSLVRLREAGFVDWVPGKVRTLALTEKGRNNDH